jgi:hypothetical protein
LFIDLKLSCLFVPFAFVFVCLLVEYNAEEERAILYAGCIYRLLALPSPSWRHRQQQRQQRTTAHSSS